MGHICSRTKELKDALARRRKVEFEVAKLRGGDSKAIYLHARACDQVRWERAHDDLRNAGYGVVPAALEDISEDLQSGKTEREVVKALSGCDGLLLVPGEDRRNLEADITYVGHHLRNSARARVSKPLPCAVVDRGLTLEGIPRLRRLQKNLRIDWINAAIADWTGAVRNWLGAAGNGVSA